MKPIISHQKISCNIGDFFSAQFSPYNEKHLSSFIPKTHLQWIGSARAGISQLLSPGEKVGLPAFTCSVVGAAVLHAQAVSVYIDSGVIVKVEDIEKQIKKIDTLLIPYNFGFMPQMDKIAMLCKKHEVRIIEDCAQALGAKCLGKLAGSFGDAVYSFGISKNIGSIGGVIATDKPFYYKGKHYPLFSRLKSYTEALLGDLFFNQYVYSVTRHLLKYKSIQENVNVHLMPDFAKYLVLAQAKRYSSTLELRRSNANYLRQELKGIIEFIEPEINTEPAWLYFVILSKNREQMRARLLAEGIDLSPLHTFRDLSKCGVKAKDAEQNHLAFALLRPRAEIEQICRAIKKVLKNETSH